MKTILSMGGERKASLNRLVGIAEDLLQGQNVKDIERMFHKHRGSKGKDAYIFKEIVTLNSELIHIFIRCKHMPEMVVTFTCQNRDNVGLLLFSARQEMLKLEKEYINECA